MNNPENKIEQKNRLDERQTPAGGESMSIDDQTSESATLDTARVDVSMQQSAAARPDLGDLAKQLEMAKQELAQSRSLIEQFRLERQTSKAAYEAGAIDVDAVAGLVEKQIALDPTLQPEAAVAKLRQLKPVLFKSGQRWQRRQQESNDAIPGREALDQASLQAANASLTSVSSGVMSGRVRRDLSSELGRAAKQAGESGEIGALMSYLRLRRAAS